MKIYTLKKKFTSIICCALLAIGCIGHVRAAYADVQLPYISQLYKGVDTVIWNISFNKVDKEDSPPFSITREEMDQVADEVLQEIFLEKYSIKVLHITEQPEHLVDKENIINLSINLYKKEKSRFIEPPRYSIGLIMGTFSRYTEQKETVLPYTFNYSPGFFLVYEDKEKAKDEFRSALKAHLIYLTRNLICQNNTELDECRREPTYLKILEVMKNSPAYPDLEKEYQFQLEEWQRSKGGVPHE